MNILFYLSFLQRKFSALHICSKYGNIKVANLLLQNGAKPDCPGKVSIISKKKKKKKRKKKMNKLNLLSNHNF